MTKRLIVYAAIAILSVCCSASSLATDIDIGGELYQQLSYDTDSRELVEADTGCRLYLEKKHGFGGKVHVSLKGNFDSLTKANSFELDEAYTSIYLQDTNLTVGKQVINWGTADGINPTNYINPIGLSLTDIALKGKPLLAAQATYYAQDFDLTGVVVPAFVQLDLSDLSSFAAGYDIAGLLDGLDLVPPEDKLENMEWALKLGTRVAGYDLQVSYFHGWEDIPALLAKLEINPITQQPDPGSLTYEGLYRSVDKIGVAAAGVLQDMGIWAEAVYVKPAKLPLESDNPLEIKLGLSPNEPYLQAILGGDHTFDNGLYAEVQYMFYGNGSLWMPYSEHPGERMKAGQYLMNRFSYDFDMSNGIELTSIANISDGSAVIMPVYTRNLAQATNLRLGVALFAGVNGEFSGHPTQFNVSLKTSF